MANIEQIKQLREETGVSVTECKKALDQSQGDLEKAKEILRVKGQSIAQKKSDRAANAGIISSYIHPGSQVGVLLDIRCETDFVARSSDFSSLAHELCLQIAAANPIYASEKDIPEEILKKEKEIAIAQFKDSNKPADIINNIIEGKIGKYKQENVLLLQAWVKNPDKTVGEMVSEYIAKMGENILPKRFARYELSNLSSNNSCV